MKFRKWSLRPIYLIPVLALMMFALACTQENPATGKKELILISTAQEVRLGLRVHNNLISSMKPSKNKKFSKKVGRIGKKIALVCDRKDVNFTFYVS